MMTLSFLETHLQNGPIKAQKNASRFIPNTVQMVGDRAEEELVAQSTPGGHMRRKIHENGDFQTNESSFERPYTIFIPCKIFNSLTWFRLFTRKSL